MTFRNAAIPAMTAALLLGCMPADARERPPIKTIGVVSDLGDRFTVKHIGFTAFTNEEADIDVSDWKTNDFINALLGKSLSPSYVLKATVFEKGSVASDKDATFFSSKSPGELVREHVKTPDGQPVDAYLVAVPQSHQIIMTNQYIKGLGLLTWGGSADIYTAMEYELIDGTTFDRIDYCHPEANDDEEGRESNMWRHKEFQYEKASDIPPEAMPKIEEAARHALEQGLAYCLRDMKLVP